MLSICIPIYNFDINSLVKELHRQLKEVRIDFEILLMDDASQNDFRKKNSSLENLQHCTYIQLNQNIGRSAIRNKLAEQASYPYLIFMDCDSEAAGDFIQKYLDAIHDKTKLIVGGRSYYNNPPTEKDQLLRWHFGRKREVFDLALRQACPHRSFLTCNFLIHKEIFKEIQFNEKLKQYGHEDTLFGFELQKRNINIQHIDNPLIHIQLEDVNEFLQKTKKGIDNLKKIYLEIENASTFVANVKLLKIYARLNRFGLSRFFAFVFKLVEPLLEKNLQSQNPNLLVFDFYKLGYMCLV